MVRIPKILVGRRKWLMARLVANGVAQAGVMILTAWLVKLIFDGFVSPDTTLPVDVAASLPWYGVGLLVAAVAIALLRMYEHVEAERMGQDYTHEVRTGLFNHMSAVSIRTLQRRSRGGVMLRFIGDLTALKQWVSLGVARLTVAGVTSVVTLTILASVNGVLALVVGSTLVAGGVAAYVMGGWLQRAVREARRRRVYLAANVSEKIASLAVVQAFGQTEREQRRVRRQSNRLMLAMVGRARAIGTFRGMVEAVAAVASGGALFAGALLVSSVSITPGTVVAVMSIVGLLMPAMRDLGRVQEYWHGAVVSREKIDDFLAMPMLASAATDAADLMVGPGAVTFENIRVAGSLNNFTATAAAGEVIALVGPNGAGKSTLLALLARLMDPDAGRVCIDGAEITGVSMASLRRAVGMVSPDLPLLRGTIERNLRYRWPAAPAEALSQASALCGIDAMLADFSLGIETRLTEDGANLSLGQRQRIGLARAILGEPRLLLLDEVDANLDPGAAAALRRVLADYRGTVLLVTHRLDWLKLADTVWYIEQGVLIESGPPTQLLGRDGPTSRLFQRPRLVGE